MSTLSNLTLWERIRVTFISLLFLNTPRRPNFKCGHFVKHVFKTARIAPWVKWKNISENQKTSPPFGECIFLLEKSITTKLWSHVGIALPFGYMIHMSYYWGCKVTITHLSEIWKRYDLAFYLILP
jgi:hypothetical protein